MTSVNLSLISSGVRACLRYSSVISLLASAVWNRRDQGGIRSFWSLASFRETEEGGAHPRRIEHVHHCQHRLSVHALIPAWRRKTLRKQQKTQPAHVWPDPAGVREVTSVSYLRQDPSKLVVRCTHHDRNLQHLLSLEKFFSCIRQKVPIHHGPQENLHLPPQPRRQRFSSRHASRLKSSTKAPHKCTCLVTWIRSSFVFPFTHRIISSVLLWSHPVRLAMIWCQKTG